MARKRDKKCVLNVPKCVLHAVPVEHIPMISVIRVIAVSLTVLSGTHNLRRVIIG